MSGRLVFSNMKYVTSIFFFFLQGCSRKQEISPSHYLFASADKLLPLVVCNLAHVITLKAQRALCIYSAEQLFHATRGRVSVVSRLVVN